MNDLISRRAAIKAIDDLPNCYNGYSDTYDKAYIIGVLEELPPIDTVPVKHGKWERHVLKNAGVPWGYDCSACGAWFVVGDDTVEKYYYCPNCGAKMQRSEDGVETETNH